MDSNNKPLLVGLHNPLSPRPEDALYPYPTTGTGGRIVSLMRAAEPQFDEVSYLMAFDRVNLWRAIRLPTGRGASAALRAEGESIARLIAGRRDAVLFGSVVWRAITGKYPTQAPVVAPGDYILQQRVGGARLWYFQHPSGRNPFYNQDDQKQAAGELLLRIAKGEVP